MIDSEWQYEEQDDLQHENEQEQEGKEWVRHFIAQDVEQLQKDHGAPCPLPRDLRLHERGDECARPNPCGNKILLLMKRRTLTSDSKIVCDG